jgi:hypothetical protein
VEELLWHYTDSAGVLGILTTGEFWASNIDFMNDATENNRLRALVGERLRSRAKSKQPDPSTVPDEMAGNLGFSAYGRSLYVASFSECRDSLSQWRAYGNFAIGFSKSFLSQLNYDPDEKIGHSGRRAYFGPVRYYSKANDEWLIDYLTRTSMGETCDIDLKWQNMTPKELRWLTPRFKDDSFSEEKEWRLICLGNVDFIGIKFRPRKSTIVPYIVVSLDNVSNQIEEIIAGPHANTSLNIKALELFRDARHWHFTVSKTTVPFRNW